MIREVSRDEWNVDVARLANRLAVVDRLEHGEVTRVLLNAARDGVQPARARVIVERLPAGQGRARGGDGRVDIVRAPLRDARERCARGGVLHLKGVTVGSTGEGAADVVSERAAVFGNPGANDGVAFWRRTITHRIEDVADGAARWCCCGSHADHTMGWR